MDSCDFIEKGCHKTGVISQDLPFNVHGPCLSLDQKLRPNLEKNSFFWIANRKRVSFPGTSWSNTNAWVFGKI